MINQHLFRSTQHLSQELARQLELHQTNIVFAESCTAGLVSGILAQVPGISQHLCGAVVTYQDEVKQEWLKISNDAIEKHSSVSEEITQQMAEAVLRQTPTADFSVSITGHLDTFAAADAPLIYVGLGYRQDSCILTSPPIRFPLYGRTRIDRQWESARAALNAAVEHLRFPPNENPNTVDWFKVCYDPVNFHWNPWT